MCDLVFLLLQDHHQMHVPGTAEDAVKPRDDGGADQGVDAVPPAYQQGRPPEVELHGW